MVCSSNGVNATTNRVLVIKSDSNIVGLSISLVIVAKDPRGVPNDVVGTQLLIISSNVGVDATTNKLSSASDGPAAPLDSRVPCTSDSIRIVGVVPRALAICKETSEFCVFVLTF